MSGDPVGATGFTQNEVLTEGTGKLAGWTKLDGTNLAASEIGSMAAAKGDKLHVIRLDADMHVRQYGVATVTAADIGLSTEAEITSVSIGETYTADGTTKSGMKLQWAAGA